jgi:hypothetical protein
VTISGLTVTHGSAADQGGRILNDGSNLTLSGDELTQNVAAGNASSTAGRGGALRSLAGTLIITGCTIETNIAEGGRGGKGGDGQGDGLPAFSGSTATLKDSTIKHNRARGGDEGASGSDGHGVGGGVYARGTFTFDALTLIIFNEASTSGDNSGPRRPSEQRVGLERSAEFRKG